MKLPIGLTCAGSASVGSENSVGAGQKPLTEGLVYDQGAPGDIAGGEDVRCRGPQLAVHLDVPAPIGPHAGSIEVQPSRRGHPSNRDHHDRGVDTVRVTVRRMNESYPTLRTLEALDRSGALDDPNA